MNKGMVMFHQESRARRDPFIHYELLFTVILMVLDWQQGLMPIIISKMDFF